jgi:hypothetical protein
MWFHTRLAEANILHERDVERSFAPGQHWHRLALEIAYGQLHIITDGVVDPLWMVRWRTQPIGFSGHPLLASR